MYRFSTPCLALAAVSAAVIAAACGAPAELDDSLFPSSYADDETGIASGGSVPSLGGTGSATSGAGGAPPVLGAGGTNVGTSGAPPVAAGGSSGAPVAAGGGGPDPSAGGCPDDITVLFNREITEGGCAGGLCHQPGATPPDLISPDPLSRLLNVASNCNGLPYIGATPEQSFLGLKITTPPGGCGAAMPFLMPEALSAEDEACILEWVAENAGG